MIDESAYIFIKQQLTMVIQSYIPEETNSHTRLPVGYFGLYGEKNGRKHVPIYQIYTQKDGPVEFVILIGGGDNSFMQS